MKLETPEWFFMWSTGSAYITTVCGWTRADVIRQAEKMLSKKWDAIYREGGRAVRCSVTPKKANEKTIGST